MKLKSILNQSPVAGDILVGLQLWPECACTSRLVILESISEIGYVIAPFGALLDDDDDDNASSSEENLNIDLKIATRCLAHPILELGDLLVHRNRRARIVETKPNDWHVRIIYEDAPGGDFYGNLIWMDLTPSLELLNITPPWSAFS